ncbi:MAG: hypothetical protein WD652_05915 [Acidimicrobiia bacterium]
MRLILDSPEVRGAIAVEIAPGGIAVLMDAEPKGMLATMFWGMVRRRALQNGLPAQVEAFARGL